MRLHVAGQRGLECGTDLGHVVDQLRAGAGVGVAAQVLRHGVDGAVQEFSQLSQDLLGRAVAVGVAHLSHHVCPERLVGHQVATQVGDQLLYDLVALVAELAVLCLHCIAIHSAGNHGLDGGVRLGVVALELVHQLVAEHHDRRHARGGIQIDRVAVAIQDKPIANAAGGGAGVELDLLAEGLGDRLDYGALLLADAGCAAAAGD